MKRLWLLPLLWAVCILIATSIPGSYIPRVNVPNLDKVVHFTFYGIFAALLLPAMPGKLSQRIALVLLFIAVFAALDEFHQKFIPGRTMDLADWIADVSGAAFSMVAHLFTRERVSA
jgi:VanZ family protein